MKRLRAFGSVLTNRFDPGQNDVDLRVTFHPDQENLFHDHFVLKFELERIAGREIDLVLERSLKNPFFKASALSTAQDIYAV